MQFSHGFLFFQDNWLFKSSKVESQDGAVYRGEYNT